MLNQIMMKFYCEIGISYIIHVFLSFPKSIISLTTQNVTITPYTKSNSTRDKAKITKIPDTQIV